MQSTDPNHAVILCVDDEENILKALKRLLRPEGYTVLSATSGALGLEVMAQHPVDLVISDMRMPKMDGAEFLERAAASWPKTVRILLTGYADVNATIAAINQGSIYKYISKPWEDNDLKLTLKNALKTLFLEREKQQLVKVIQEQSLALLEFNEQLDRRVKERTAELEQAVSMQEAAQRELKKNFTDSLKIFSNLIEMRHERLAGHSRRVAALAKYVAQTFALPDAEIEHIGYAGLLHDIGKIGLPDSILNQSFFDMDDRSRKELMKHSVFGQTILTPLAPLKHAATLIRSHHEYYDGSGYPDGLAGDAIPLGARIITVVNEYEGLQTGTIFRKRYSSTDALEFMRKNRGIRYDAEVVDQFVDWMKHGPKDPLGERVVHGSAALKIGMIISKDLIDEDGFLLVTEGNVVDERIIDNVRRYEKSNSSRKLQIYVRDRR